MKRTASIITSSAIAFFVSITGLSCIELQKRANSVFKDARFDGETHRMERVTAQADHPLQAIRTGDGYELDY